MYKVRVDRAFNIDGYNLWILKYDTFRKKGWIAKPIDLEFVEHAEHAIFPSPTLQIHNGDWLDGAQLLRAIADGITEAGIFPSNVLSSDKEVKALKENLKDLREITQAHLGLMKSK